MACRLFGAKPLPEPMLAYCQMDTWEQISMEFESKFYHFYLKNAFEIVVSEMAAILSRADELHSQDPMDSETQAIGVINCTSEGACVKRMSVKTGQMLRNTNS